MSKDIIYREDAIWWVKTECNPYGKPTLDFESGKKVIEHLEHMPSADRPQGEWIDMGDFEQCSVCKGTRLKEFQSYYGKVTWIKTPYCPSCGARMKGADDETD